MSMDVVKLVSNVSSVPVSVCLTQMIEAVIEMGVAAKDVLIQQESFASVSAHLNRIIPILNELLCDHISDSAVLKNVIEILSKEISAVKNLTFECIKRNKVYLLLNCRIIVKRLEAIMKEIGHGLGLILIASLELSTNIVEEIENLKDSMMAAEFQVSFIEELIMEKIETGIQERIFDRSYANKLMCLIAEAVGIPSERSAMRKEFEEFKSDMVIQDMEEGIQMDQIIALLGRADAILTTEEKQEKYLAQRHSLGDQLVEPFEAFYCPISGDVMVNPVETSSGHTFERSKIEKWFAEGKDLCPLTMIPVDTSVLRPNKNLRLAIEEWKDRNTMITIGLLKPKLCEVNPNVLHCLKQLQDICEEKVAHCEWVVFEDCLPPLANLLRAKNRDIIKGALRILHILANDNDDVKAIISKIDGAIPLVVRSLGRQTEERKLAISLLLDMSKCDRLQDSIGKVNGCILLLVTMSRSNDNQESKKAQELLERLSLSKQHTLQMAKANYFKPLLQLLSSGSRDVKLLMTKTLGEMELSNHSKSELVDSGVLNLLMPLLSDENLEMQKEAANAFRNLSSIPQNGLRMIKEGAVRPLLHLLSHHSLASQCWHEVVVTTIMNLAISTETDQVQVTFFETEDDIFKLFSPINSTGPSSQQKLLQAFQAFCHSPEATKVKGALMQCSALQLLVKLCENENLKVQANAMKLFSCLVEDCDEPTLLKNQVDKKCIETLLKAINSFDDDQDVDSALSIISNFPDGAQIKDWLREAKAVSVICSVIKKSMKNKVLTENAVGALSRLTSPSDIISQKIASGAGVIPLLVTLLETGTAVSKMHAAFCLAQFSLNSHSLSKKVQRHSGFVCFTAPPEPACPLHKGICSVETSFCLVEADAVDPLVNILAEPNPAACEASLDALLTLIDCQNPEQGCKLLAEAEAIPLIIKLLSSPFQNLQEKALLALERIFRVPEYNLKFESSAQLPLVDIASRGTMSMRSLAAKTLAHMHLLHDQSSYF